MLNTTKDLHAVSLGLRDLVKRVPTKIASQDTAELVALGHKLGQIAKHATASLELLKETMRKEAMKARNGDSGSEVFPGSDGSSCTVSIPRPSMSIKKNADIEGLKVALGERFSFFFETVTTYKLKDTFGARVAQANKEHQSAVLKVIDVTEGTARVSFKR